MMADMVASRQKPVARGIPPRVVLPPRGAILPYYKPRRGRDWLLLPDNTLPARIAAAARALGAIVFVVALVMIAINYDEFDQATQRLSLPFPEPNMHVSWSRPGHVAWRRDVALQRIWQWTWIGCAGLATVAAGAIYEWRRRHPRMLDAR
jgi:hypothetical protein